MADEFGAVRRTPRPGDHSGTTVGAGDHAGMPVPGADSGRGVAQTASEGKDSGEGVSGRVPRVWNAGDTAGVASPDPGDGTGDLRADLAELINDSRDASDIYRWSFLDAADAVLAAGWRPPLPDWKKELTDGLGIDDANKIYTESDLLEAYGQARRKFEAKHRRAALQRLRGYHDADAMWARTEGINP